MINSWVRGKTWWVYAFLSGLYGYTAYRLFSFPDWTIPYSDRVNLGVHTFGHTMFEPMGEFLHVAGGSIAEIMLPAFVALVLFKKGRLFTGMASLLWLVVALRTTSGYIVASTSNGSAAASLSLETSGVLPSKIHDWQYLVDNVGVIRSLEAAKAAVDLVAVSVSVAIVLLSVYLVCKAFIGLEATKVKHNVPSAPKNSHKHQAGVVYSSDPAGYPQKR